MLGGITNRFDRWRFDVAVRNILATPPAKVAPASPAVLLSQLQHKDLRMFLLAAKSFSAHVPISHVYVVNDGSLSADDKGVLKAHFPAFTLFDLADFRSQSCPTGACWERLLTIAELVKNHYVIQLDSDTLTIGDVPELRANIANGVAFTIGTFAGQGVETMRERCEIMRAKNFGPNAHVQQVTESNFDKLRNYDSLRYVKGCAGFTAFSRGSFTREFVEEVSSEIEAAIGPKWREWGSEQVMSNIVVANIPGSVVLPFPKYSDCLNIKADETAFIHFIGTCRFDRGIYAKLGGEAIRALRRD